MRKSEVKKEMDAIRVIFQEEQQLFHELSHADLGPKETGNKIRAHMRKNYAKDLMGVHAHHTHWPVTGRDKPGRHPVKEITDLAAFYTKYTTSLERLPRQYATLVWLNVKEDGDSGERFAVACLVYEGLRQFRTEAKWAEDDHDPYYLYLSAYMLRKAKPTSRTPNPPWRIRFIFAGLPVDKLHCPGGKLYRRKISDAKRMGPKGKKQWTIKDLKKLHGLHGSSRSDEYQAAWYSAIPKGRELFRYDFTWNDYKSVRRGVFFWDLLGWDVIFNGSGS